MTFSMIRRRAVPAAVVAALCMLLTACGGLPTSGPVNAGQTIAADDADSIPVFLPDAPAKDATAQQIVEGFIAAGSGTSGNWETARLYLAPDYKDWNPREGVVVAVPGERVLEEESTGEFTLTVTPVATVDASGVMTSEDADLRLPYSVAKQSDGQWRITQAPQGIVLDRNRFTAVFGPYDLQFFDSTWTYLVPDRRWFPKQYAATTIASALVDGGPSPWLEGAVATAFTDVARLATPSVPTRSNVAAVSLQDGARELDATVLNRMQTQLQASLAQARCG
jgi:Sporulation and spore germination.